MSTKEIKPIIDHWVYKSGCARFNISFTFNRKKTSVEIELKQDMVNQKGYKKYTGPITFIIQEIDGSFTHHLQVDDNAACKFEIACHSKGKKSKKKKIPLITGEEVDIDTTQMETDSPILWIRVDPDLKILREVKFEQPDIHWQNQLKYERDICAQLDSVEMLLKFPTTQTRAALIAVTENPECFYKVRINSSYALAEVSNKMAHSYSGPLPLISTFKKFFSSTSNPNLVTNNNFSDIQNYFLEKNLPIAMGNLRTTHNTCPNEVLRFLLDLSKFNENSKNSYSDAYYRASLVDALTNTISPSIAALTNDGPKSANLSPEMHSVIEEIVLRLNLEKLVPTYRYVVTASCLKAIRKLQRLGHCPEDAEIFKSYCTENIFDDLRAVAFEILVEFLTFRNDEALIEFLLNVIENDHSFFIKQHLINQLCKVAPLKLDDSPKIAENIVHRLWSLMEKFNLNYRLKYSIADLYQSLFGIGKPKCLKSAKESYKLVEKCEAFSF